MIRDAAIVLGWVAPTPRRAIESERILRGKRVTEDVAREAATAAVAGATPLAKNAYKVPVLETVVRRTILAAAGRAAGRGMMLSAARSLPYVDICARKGAGVGVRRTGAVGERLLSQRSLLVPADRRVDRAG